jgi:hypothetical protein
MIGFHVSYGSNRAFAIDNLIKIGARGRPDANGTRWHTLKFKDGETVEMSTHEIEMLLARPMKLLPAEAGSQLLNFYYSDPEGPGISRTPLIAWALCLDGEIRPVTPSGVDDGISEPEDGWHVEMPGGRVFAANNWHGGPGLFETADEALSYFVGERERRASEAEA